MSWVAYIDEAMRQRHDGTGLYVLAAAVMADDDTMSIREAVRGLAGRRHRRVHWRDAEVSERHKAVALVADLSALHLVVIGVRLDLRRQERGRRLCLQRLLWELGRAGVSRALLESRTAGLNAKDLALVNVLRVRGEIMHELRVDFVYPLAEPLVWLPDIVAGAVSSARGDDDDRYLGPLKSILTEYSIELD